MKRLDHGHLHPKLEVSGLTCSSRESNPGLRGGSTLEKSHSNGLFIAVRTAQLHERATTGVPNVRDSIFFKASITDPEHS
jgi:hypothetical protein